MNMRLSDIRRIFIILALAVFCISSYAQEEASFYVIDSETQVPLEFAIVYLKSGDKHWEGVSNATGQVSIKLLPYAEYQVTCFLMGYKQWDSSIKIGNGQAFTIPLVSNSYALNEVVVTAAESKGLSTSSIIDKKAMQHLQPSSFADLLELLPGGKSKDPNFGSMNAIKIREVGLEDTREGKYSISSLGTSFVVDNTPISTSADMQYLMSGDKTIGGVSGNTDSKRSTVNRGVDMRTIPTDQIERVEVIRGIPSVVYGDLTSGVVVIERKKGASPWLGRLKVDAYSKLFAVNKGYSFDEQKLSVNLGVDFLDSNVNPTSSFENYQRFTSSIRVGKLWNNENYDLKWQSNISFAHTFDQIKVDPNRFDDVQEDADIESLKKEKYKSKYNKIAYSSILSFIPRNTKALKTITLNTSIDYQMDKIEQTKFVQLSSLTLTIPTLNDTGIADGIFLPNTYISEEYVDGKPLNLFIQAKADFDFKTNIVNHKSLVGLEYTMDKNYGKGQVFDPLHPSNGDNYYRPRDYSQIPAKQNLNFFVEDQLSMPIGFNLFKLAIGVRGMSMVAMDSQYKMNGKLYLDPRLNAIWNFKRIQFSRKNLNIGLAGGLGWNTKFPTLLQIYPDYVYNDYVRLNYYDPDNMEQSRVNYETFRRKTINYNLEPARNKKWEFGINFEYDNNNLAITYFQEKMTNGFRNSSLSFTPITTRKYYNNVETVVIDPITNQPDLELSKYKEQKYLLSNEATTNGTQIEKKGIEFTLSTKRFKALMTRLTITGAWFQTKYKNSGVFYEGTTQILGGEERQAVGLYPDDYGYYREQLSTNFMFDTNIPMLGFEFSTSFQCVWFRLEQNIPVSQYPYAYIDMDGNTHPYTDASKNDPLLQFLQREPNQGRYKKFREPFGMDINFKASKNIKDIVRISMFVNKLFDFYPIYHINGAEIRRSQKPYFGMELNISI